MYSLPSTDEDSSSVERMGIFPTVSSRSELCRHKRCFIKGRADMEMTATSTAMSFIILFCNILLLIINYLYPRSMLFYCGVCSHFYLLVIRNFIILELSHSTCLKRISLLEIAEFWSLFSLFK